MNTHAPAGLYVAALFFVITGLLHFVQQKFFIKAMPPYIPFHKAMVQVSGVAEILLGMGLLFTDTQAFAARGLILLLVAVFPANIYMATSGRFRKIPAVLLWLRLPLQVVLIWWVYQYS